MVEMRFSVAPRPLRASTILSPILTRPDVTVPA